jgi:hypothetical protein
VFVRGWLQQNMVPITLWSEVNIKNCQ